MKLNMALKKSSETVTISATVTESAANTFTQTTVPLPLSPLDKEVFVVTMINLDPDAPDSVVGTSTDVNVSITTTNTGGVGTIANSQVMASARSQIICNGGMTADGGIPFVREDPLASDPNSGYIGIIATDDFFLNIIGTNNGNVKSCRARLYGYRAKADASTYAALVQSELLS
jgi:hypothetical protein